MPSWTFAEPVNYHTLLPKLRLGNLVIRGDYRLNTLMGLVINAMQHGMIYVGSAELPPMDTMNRIEGPGPEDHNRLGSFVGPMAASLQVDPPETPPKGDLEMAEAYGKRVAQITLQFVRGR